MAIIEEENLVAAAAGVEQLVRDLQRTVRSGITKTEKWRIQQLKALLKLIVENQDSLLQAVFTDLGKPAHQVVFTEVQTLCLCLSLSAFETPQLNEFGGEIYASS
jgi:aldehyde dehydrogenase (NAD+)